VQSSHRFSFNFADQPCRLEIVTDEPAASAIFTRYLAMFPHFAGSPALAPRYTVRIRDVSGLTPTLQPLDTVFPALRAYLTEHYPGLDPALLARICSPAFIPDAAARDVVAGALARPAEQGVSLQKDFLVCSAQAAGLVEAFADVRSSMQEAWPFHALNFFKIFFFANDTVRLHGSGATAGDRCVLLLANTGGGKSTVKDLFLKATRVPVPFTDDSILAVRGPDGFRLYQDPVEFMRWCLMPEAELPRHAIPAPRAAIRTAPAVYYLSKGETTRWHACEPEEIFTRANQEAFFQRGFLTQRFIPPPGADERLEAYFRNTRALLAGCRCHLAEIRYHDDYGPLFQHFSRDLGLPEGTA
jgi:hypothetical protein